MRARGIGEREWKVRQRREQKRRVWPKVRMAVDTDIDTLVVELLTDMTPHDDAINPRLEQVDELVEALYGDGALDQ